EYIVVEVLRLFCPGAYHRVRGYGYCFAGSAAESDTEAGAPEGQSLRSFHEAWITQIPPRDKEATRRLLSLLFPRVSRVWGGPTSLFARRPASGREISNPLSFPNYFRLAVPDDTVPSADIAGILTNAADSPSLAAELRRLAACSRPDGRSWARSALEQLVEYTDREMTEAQVPVVLQALFESGDEMVRPEDEPRGIFDQSSGFMVRRIIWRLLLRLDEPRRYLALEAATARGRALSTIVNAVTMMAGGAARNTAAPPDSGQMLTPAHLSHLEVAMLQRIRAAAADRSLLAVPQLAVALSRWQACGDQGEAEAWVRGVSASDAGLVLLIERFYRLSLADFFDVEDHGPRPFFDLESFQRFLDPSAAAARAQRFVGDARLSANQQAALSAFLERAGENRTRTDP
ncbi:MAG: hypothetical protein LC772_12695, partial [Chloroflexi bacterium]|nr:hypothetical protein [Chloroflexota bacterium]